MKSSKKKVVAKKKVYKSFGDWWEAVASKKVAKVEKNWIKNNEPNDSEDEGGGDHWHVNEMMHEGGAFEVTAELAEEVWNKGSSGEKWEMTMGDSLFCELDDVIFEAYEAGKASRA